jgi:carbon-monoxide dehydrogenase large subunit
VDDFGATLNPLLLPARCMAGRCRASGQALMESTVYDPASGQLLSASFMDYAMPRAGDAPDFVFETRNVPCKTNPLGVKGAGEAGAIGSCPAVMNAIVDALWRAHRIRHYRHACDPAARLAGDPLGAGLLRRLVPVHDFVITAPA